MTKIVFFFIVSIRLETSIDRTNLVEFPFPKIFRFLLLSKKYPNNYILSRFIKMFDENTEVVDSCFANQTRKSIFNQVPHNLNVKYLLTSNRPSTRCVFLLVVLVNTDKKAACQTTNIFDVSLN